MAWPWGIMIQLLIDFCQMFFKVDEPAHTPTSSAYFHLTASFSNRVILSLLCFANVMREKWHLIWMSLEHLFLHVY